MPTVRKIRQDVFEIPVATTLAEQAYELLEEKIITLQLAPGQLLSETALAGELHIGRTPIREALQKLAQTGLVVILPHKGILISEVNPLNQLRLLEFRQVSEQLMVRCATIRNTSEQKTQFYQLAEQLEAAAARNDVAAFMRFDNIFHVSTALATHNEYLYRALEIYHSLSRRFWYAYNNTSSNLQYCSNLHADLARQIASGNPDRAVAAHEKLIQHILEVLQATMTLS